MKNKTIIEVIDLITNASVDGSASTAVVGIEASSSKRSKELLPTLVQKLGTSLNVPEEEVIKQDSDTPDKDMFFIGKGDCEVRVRDERGREHEQIRLLVEGDHFGEISLIYKCKRSASVISRNYNTLAKMTSDRYRELVAEYPEYEVCLKKYIRETYNDPKIRFIVDMLERVEYLQGVKREIIFDLMFNLKPRSFEQGSVMLYNE